MALTSSDWRRYLYPDPTGQMPAAGLLVTYLHQTDPLGASDLGLEWSPEPCFTLAHQALSSLERSDLFLCIRDTAETRPIVRPGDTEALATIGGSFPRLAGLHRTP